MTERKLVFVSHANPEDNEFASWLGTRLVAAGYEVWADVFQLVGGEAFWRDIGAAIKEEAAAAIVVISKASYQKDGVLDENAMQISDHGSGSAEPLSCADKSVAPVIRRCGEEAIEIRVYRGALLIVAIAASVLVSPSGAAVRSRRKNCIHVGRADSPSRRSAVMVEPCIGSAKMD